MPPLRKKPVRAPFKILVCGGRDLKDLDKVYRVLYKYQQLMDLEGRTLSVCQGGAPGTDALAAMWCKGNKVPCETFVADWFKHNTAAGPIRNRKMLDEFQPDVVVAFPGGDETADMLGYARKKKVPVREID